MEGQPTLTCAIYLRVSKKDGSQTVANQRPEVEQLVSARGFRVVEVYEDRESAVKRRPAFDRMMEDGRRGRFSVVVVWALDRLGRGFSCFDSFRDLLGWGVRVVSVRESWTDVADPQLRQLLASVASFVSGVERERLISRTMAGLERARAMGKKIGRPRVTLSPDDLSRALQLRESGLGIRSIAAQLKTRVGASTLHRLLQAHDALGGAGIPRARTGTETAATQAIETTRAA